MTSVFTQDPGLREKLSPQVINIYPFLVVRKKLTNDKILTERLASIHMGFIPNTFEWHQQFHTDLAAISKKAVDGRWLYNDSELPSDCEPEDPTPTPQGAA